jgi:hypothetical protein
MHAASDTSEPSFEVSNTAMEVESSIESINDVADSELDVSTPQNSQEDGGALTSNFMQIALSPLKGPHQGQGQMLFEGRMKDMSVRTYEHLIDLIVMIYKTFMQCFVLHFPKENNSPYIVFQRCM